MDQPHVVMGTSESPESNATQYRLPKLDTLTFTWVAFKDRHHFSPSIRGDLDNLKRWLLQRRELGMGIKEVHIRQCKNVTSAVVRELEDCVGAEGKVVWDGKPMDE